MNKFPSQIKPPEKPHNIKSFFRQYGKIILLWIGLAAIILILLNLGVDKKIVAFITVVVGFVTQAFVGMAALIGLVPFIGPIIIKLLSIPFFWFLNGTGYFVSIVAIKKGYSKDVAKSRILTITLLSGIVIGYVLGHLLPLR